MNPLVITQDQKRRAYKVICGEIRRRIQLNCSIPQSQAARDQIRKCWLWKELLPGIYANAEKSVYQSPTFD